MSELRNFSIFNNIPPPEVVDFPAGWQPETIESLITQMEIESGRSLTNEEIVAALGGDDSLLRGGDGAIE